MLQKDDYEELLEYAPDSIIIVNSEGKIVFVNKQTENLFLFSRHELIGQPIELLIPNRYHHAHYAHIHNFFKAPSMRPMGHPGVELLGKRKNLEEFPVEISLSPIKTEGKVWVIASIRDISLRIKIEKELKEAQNLFKRIFEFSIHGIVRMQAVLNNANEIIDFKYTLLNKRGAELLGQQREELIGKTIREIFPGIEHRDTFQVLVDVVRSGNTQIREVLVPIKGVEVWFKASYVKMDDGIIITFDDISHRKLAQKRLEEYKEELEKRVSERTKDLVTSNDRLRQIIEKLDKYAYLISHDLKAPLNNILGLAEFIKEDYQDKPLDQEGKEMMDMIISKSEEMKLMIENLLQTAKDEIKNRELINIQQLALDVIQTLNPPSHFHILIQHNLPVISYPKTSMIQILQNLFSNAIKYSDKDSPLISLTFDENNHQYLFCISDNGMGIAEDKIEGIFELFEVANPNQKKVESHGIGLSIVKQLVEENGGEIWVESVLGVGSKFHFTVPK